MTVTTSLRQLDMPRDVSAIVPIAADRAQAYVPPISDYKNPSEGWSEAEYRCFATPSDHVTVGYWVGEPGSISFDAWPYTEVCSILSGKVAVRDPFGGQREFGPGNGFVVPKGWAGDWLTLEPSTKIFIAID